jgi:hypothetical protein
MGGYCPGTSCVAASSGRLDAFSLFAGMMAGVFLFAEAFPALREFYMETPLGRVTIPELFHIPHAAVVIAVVIVAAAGFFVAERVEARNGGRIEQPPV